MVELSELTGLLVENLFHQDDLEMVQWLLVQECADNLPFLEGSGPEELERVRFAALKISGGDLDRLLEAIDLGQADWRDLLVAAGFGSSLHAHQEWARNVIRKS